jgi:hypothetical protein
VRRAVLVLAAGVMLGTLWGAPPSHADLGRSGSVVGRVLDGCGRPVVRADLGVARTRPVVSVPLIAIWTNRRGRYDYSPLEPARYWITVRARGFRAQTKTVVVRAGRTSRLNFRFRRCQSPELTG